MRLIDKDNVVVNNEKLAALCTFKSLMACYVEIEQYYNNVVSSDG